MSLVQKYCNIFFKYKVSSRFKSLKLKTVLSSIWILSMLYEGMEQSQVKALGNINYNDCFPWTFWSITEIVSHSSVPGSFIK
jgi:hypothetical protein